MQCNKFDCKNAVYNKQACKYCMLDDKPKTNMECYVCLYKRTKQEGCDMCKTENCNKRK